MKRFNKQILEAVHRGIQLALDDYQDIDPNNSISQDNDIIDNGNDMEKIIFFHKNFVDLGLPSGTLWAKYNLGANLENIQNEEYKHKGLLIPEDWYGDYYSWGELEPKEKYSWETYKFGGEKSLTKYCDDEDYGKKIIDETMPWGYWRYEDNLKELRPEDDIVTQTYGKQYHMPTESQCQELLEYCTYKWETDYKGIKGLNGYILVSNINHNSIFIPAAGLYQSYGLQYKKHIVRVWSSTLYYGPSARIIQGNNVEFGVFLNDKYAGASIRAVYNK